MMPAGESGPAVPHTPAARNTKKRHVSLWLGGASLAFVVFLRVTRELLEGEVTAADRTVLLAIAGTRRPWLTSVAVDITALGSITIVFLVTIFAIAILLAYRRWIRALHLATAATGAALLTLVSKDAIERTRPDDLPALITVSGFSYPSGHSVATAAVYLTIAIILSRNVKGRRVRIVIISGVSVIVLLVAASRVYLGVHYPTDVVSGLALGTGWALLLSGLFAYISMSRASRRRKTTAANIAVPG